MPKSGTVIYQNEDGWVKLEVRRANGLMGMERSRLQYEGERAMSEKSPPAGPAERLLRSISYPDLSAAVVKAEGKLRVGFGEEDDDGTIDMGDHWPLTFDEFAKLPDDLILTWETKVYQVNPHWNPAGEPQEMVEKKEPNSTEG